jgi:hypothetical protein
LDINNERQDCKIRTWWAVLVGWGRVSEGDYGEVIWWMYFIYLYGMEKRNLLQLL